jgi:hypothetical protein
MSVKTSRRAPRSRACEAAPVPPRAGPLGLRLCSGVQACQAAPGSQRACRACPAPHVSCEAGSRRDARRECSSLARLMARLYGTELCLSLTQSAWHLMRNNLWQASSCQPTKLFSGPVHASGCAESDKGGRAGRGGGGAGARGRAGAARHAPDAAPAGRQGVRRPRPRHHRHVRAPAVPPLQTMQPQGCLVPAGRAGRPALRWVPWGLDALSTTLP